MVSRLVIRPRALLEIDEACDWYERRGAGLGAKFLRTIEAHIAMIQQQPEMHAIAFNPYRKAKVQGFPYVVYYECSEDADTVTIYSVFHTAQNPDALRDRLP